MDLRRVTDHTAQGLALLIEQYQGMPRLNGLLSSYLNRIQEFEDINWAVITSRLLDYTDPDTRLTSHPVGAQLATIGKLVGQPNNGWDDATYLVYIRARIFLNKSKALRGEIITLLKLIESTAFTYNEVYPCTVLIDYAVSTATSPLVLTDIAKKAVTGGVRLALTAPYFAGPDGFFVWGDALSTVTGGGFGHLGSTSYGGTLASVYE